MVSVLKRAKNRGWEWTLLFLIAFFLFVEPGVLWASTAQVRDFDKDGKSDVALLYDYGSGSAGIFAFLSANPITPYFGTRLYKTPTGIVNFDKAKPSDVSRNLEVFYLGWIPGREIPIYPGQIGRIVIKGARSWKNEIYIYDLSGNLIVKAPCSTGRHYGTPLGRYRVITKRLVMISYSGTLYARYPTYFRKNYAVHGWPRSVRTHRFYHYELLGRPASAGCVRVPEEIAKAIWVGSTIGQTVVEVLP